MNRAATLLLIAAALLAVTGVALYSPRAAVLAAAAVCAVAGASQIEVSR